MQPYILALVIELKLPSFGQHSTGDVIFKRMSREGQRRHPTPPQEATSFRLVGGSATLVRVLSGGLPQDHLVADVPASAFALEDGLLRITLLGAPRPPIPSLRPCRRASCTRQFASRPIWRRKHRNSGSASRPGWPRMPSSSRFMTKRTGAGRACQAPHKAWPIRCQRYMTQRQPMVRPPCSGFWMQVRRIARVEASLYCRKPAFNCSLASLDHMSPTRQRCCSRIGRLIR